MTDTTKRGFFRRNTVEPSPVAEVRAAVPDMTTSPPTWAEISTASISVREALDIPEVSAAHRIITTAVSQLSMTVERAGVEIVSAVASRPDSDRSQSAFLKRTATDLCLYGNAYWRIYRNSDGLAVNVIALDPTRVLIRYNDNGTKFYEYTNAQGRQERLTNNSPTSNGQVEHIKLAELPGYVEGLGPIQMNNSRLAKIKAQLDYYVQFLEDAKRPSGIYSFSQLDADEAAHTLEVIKSKYATGEPMVLSGATYQSVMFNAEQAALVQMKDAASLDIARIFGVPPHKIAAAINGNSMTYQNVGQADRAWVRESLEEYLTAIEDAMTNVLPRGQVATFETDNWLRAAEAIAVATDAGTTEKETALDAA